MASAEAVLNSMYHKKEAKSMPSHTSRLYGNSLLADCLSRQDKALE